MITSGSPVAVATSFTAYVPAAVPGGTATCTSTVFAPDSIAICETLTPAPSRSLVAPSSNGTPPAPTSWTSNGTSTSPPATTSGTSATGLTARSRVANEESSPGGVHEMSAGAAQSTAAEPSSAASVSSRQPPVTAYRKGPSNGAPGSGSENDGET